METAKITFYRILQAGYYLRGQSNPEFGNVLEMLENLRSWSVVKTLIETKTYSPVDGSDSLPVYLMDIAQGNHGWIVTMWNETPTVNGSNAAVIGGSSVGRAEVILNDVPDGGIAGFATYFWFVPDHNVFASIRFQHLITGQPAMQEYMESYLSLFSPNVVRTNPGADTDVQISGYRRSPSSSVENVHPRFRTQLATKPGDYEFLKSEASRIRKVHRKTVLDLRRAQDLSFWQGALQKVGLRQVQELQDSVRIRYEINADLNREQVSEMIDSWVGNHGSEWDDYGFQLRGESSPRWLSRSIIRNEFDLDISRDNAEVVNSASLVTALDLRRQTILGLL